jgi:hypothetical protein
MLNKSSSLAPGVDLIKLFRPKFTHTLFKLDRFINMPNICCVAMKRPSLDKHKGSLHQKSFKCDQIRKRQRLSFCHTLLRYLSST